MTGTIETANRQIRKAFEEQQPPSDDLRSEVIKATQQVSAIRIIRKDLRQVLAARLRADCGSKGYLIGTVVFRAAHDEQGVEMIQLANSPTRGIA